MQQNHRPTRCPACWAALPATVGLHCPHCGKAVDKAAKRSRRRRNDDAVTAAETTGVAAAAPVGPPAPDAEPPSWAAAPAASAEPPSWAPPPASASAAGSWSPPYPSAVATLEAPPERDPVEFPGTPLPPNFFPPVPVRRRPPLGRKAVGIGVAVVIGLGGAVFQWADRNEAIASPARDFIKEPCALYRDIAFRLEQDADDAEAAEMAYYWFQDNLGDFERAAHLDPELTEAAASVRWFNDTLADPARIDATSDAEFDEWETPVNDACTTGPGRP